MRSLEALEADLANLATAALEADLAVRDRQRLAPLEADLAEAAAALEAARATWLRAASEAASRAHLENCTCADAAESACPTTSTNLSALARRRVRAAPAAQATSRDCAARFVFNGHALHKSV